MTIVLALANCSLALLVTVLALVREVRLRRALEQLLARLLPLWRNRQDKSMPGSPGSDTERAPDGRMPWPRMRD